MPLALRKAHDLVLDRRAIARARPRSISPEYIGERCEIGADQRVRRRGGGGDVAGDLRRRDPLGQNENGGGGSSPCCTSSPAQSIVLPSSRGGVPVLSRPRAKPYAARVSARPMRGRLADPAGGDLFLADMDEPVQKRAGGQHHPAGRRSAGRRRARPRSPAPSRSSSRSSAAPSAMSRFGVSASNSCIARR